MDGTPATQRQRQLENPWWLWPNVLSLDAPAVAVVWQLLFARALRVNLLPVTVALLASGAWCTYVLDRLLDAHAPGAASQPGWRHAFYFRHQRIFWALVTLVGCVSLPVAVIGLPAPVLRGGIVLSGLSLIHI